MAIVIGRPINGISINGHEYVLDDDGMEMLFSDEQAAKDFLREHSVTDEEIDIEGIVFEEVEE